MVDGVPVNDMENGWVYWSNWFGLDAITQSMQVQRGLGASKIVSPSVGGTINIVTSGMENKFGVKLRYEAGSGLFNRVTVGYNSGKLKGDWGITFAGSFKYRDGWVDKANSLGGFYYLKVQKKLGNHMLSISGFGAPQKHGQRSYKAPIATWNHDKALRYGADTTGWVERGYRYNEHWGLLTRRTGEEELINEKLNYYHKPQLTLRHFGKLKEGLYLSNLVYASIGNGGGTKMYDYGGAYRTPDGQIDFDRIWDANQFTEIAGNIYPTIDPIYDSTALKSSNILKPRSAVIKIIFSLFSACFFNSVIVNKVILDHFCLHFLLLVLAFIPKTIRNFPLVCLSLRLYLREYESEISYIVHHLHYSHSEFTYVVNKT